MACGGVGIVWLVTVRLDGSDGDCDDEDGEFDLRILMRILGIFILFSSSIAGAERFRVWK